MKDAPVRHAVEYAAYSGAKGLVRLLPHAWVRRLGRGVGELAWHLDRRHRRVTLANLELAFPELDPDQRRRRARACFHHFGSAVFDTVSAMRFDLEEMCRRVTVEGWENVQEAEGSAAPRGYFVMSAHLGVWEMAALVLGTYAGPLHIVGRPLDNPHLNRELVSHRRRFGNELLGKRGAARGMLRALHGGDPVAILIDQRVQPKEGIDVPFFGHDASTSPILARLSIRLGVPVLPIYGLPAPGGRYKVVLKPPIHPPELAGDAGDEAQERAIHELTARYMAEMEGEIRAHPDKWLWMHRRWR